MIDGTKPELHWQRATQWGCNWQQVLEDDLCDIYGDGNDDDNNASNNDDNDD